MCLRLSTKTQPFLCIGLCGFERRCGSIYLLAFFLTEAVEPQTSGAGCRSFPSSPLNVDQLAEDLKMPIHFHRATWNSMYCKVLPSGDDFKK